MNLIEIFQPSFRNKKDKVALNFQDKTWTFGEIDQISEKIAQNLTSYYHVCKGDRVSMYLENCPETIFFYLAALKIGAIVTPFNLLYKKELNYLIQDAEPKVILIDKERYEVFKPLSDNFPSLRNVFSVNFQKDDCTPFEQLCQADNQEHNNINEAEGDTPALMIYTSGTTGRSKGALLTHNNLSSNIVTLLQAWQWSENDNFLLCLPLFHVHGLCNGIHGWLASGCSMTLLPRFKADIVMQYLDQRQMTMFFGVPTMYERLLEQASEGLKIPQSIRLYVSGSAPLSIDTFKNFKDTFGHEILERYGMSETAMITSNLYAGPRGQGTVGKALPGVQVKIVGENGETLQGSDVGEIQVKGPNVFHSYWKQPEKTKESFIDGWFKTGDLACYDDEGRITIQGRAKELIISGGFNIYPQEIIQCLVDHQDIKEAAVIGVPNQRRGELVKAYLVSSNASLTEEEMIKYCKEQLASFKVPKGICFLDKLPRNAMGKLQLKELPDRERL